MSILCLVIIKKKKKSFKIICMFISFQLIDDVLDFTSCADCLGKPAAADLKLGLATGPVLFACRQVSQQQCISPKQKVFTCSSQHTQRSSQTCEVYCVSDEHGLGRCEKSMCSRSAGFSVHTRVLSGRETPSYTSPLNIRPLYQNLVFFCCLSSSASPSQRGRYSGELLHVFCRLFLSIFLLMFWALYPSQGQELKSLPSF